MVRGRCLTKGRCSSRWSGSRKGTVQATHYVGKQSAGKTYSDAGGKKTVIPVKQGLNMIRLQHQGYEGKETLSYKLSSRFFIYEDPFESNDLQYQAYTIPARTQDIVGTFGHTGDVDWYMIQLPRKGTLRLKVSVDTVRIDPALEVRGSHIRTQWIDEEKEGRSESAVLTDLPAGNIIFKCRMSSRRIRNRSQASISCMWNISRNTPIRMNRTTRCMKRSR